MSSSLAKPFPLASLPPAYRRVTLIRRGFEDHCAGLDQPRIGHTTTSVASTSR